MKRIARRLAGLLLACMLAACSGLAEPLGPLVQEVDRATLLLPGEPPRETRLPDAWERSAPLREGGVRYRIDLEQAALEAGPAALFIPRVGLVLRVVLNGEPIAQFGSTQRQPLPDVSQQPILVALPPALLRSRGNVLELEVHGEPRREAGLSRLWVGPLELLEPRHVALGQLQSRGAWAVGAAAAVMGALALLLASRVRHFGYACFGVGSLLWAWRVTAFEPGGSEAWSPILAVLFQVSYPWFVVLMSLYALAVVGRDGPRARQLLAGWAVVALVLTVLGWLSVQPGLRTAVLAGSQGVLILVGGALILRAARDRQLAAVLLAVAALACLVVGARDLWVFRVMYDYGAVSWGRYTILALLAVLAWTVVDDFARSARGLQALNRNLAERVAQKESELARAFDGAREREREQATRAERDRILREMHDGLGGRLVAAMALTQQVQRVETAETTPPTGSRPPAETGPPPPAETLRELRAALDDCLVELRLALDSLETDRRPLVEALAELRFRVEPSLRAAGIRLVWQPSDAVIDWSLPATDTLQVLRIVREALTNVIKHAQASTVWLRLAPLPPESRELPEASARLPSEAPSERVLAPWTEGARPEAGLEVDPPETGAAPEAETEPAPSLGVCLSVIDNGLQRRQLAEGSELPHFVPEGLHKGRGLANMERRAAALGARLSSGPSEEGWAVELRLPPRG